MRESKVTESNDRERQSALQTLAGPDRPTREKRRVMRRRRHTLLRTALASSLLVAAVDAHAVTTFPASVYYIGGPQDSGTMFTDPGAAAASVCAFWGWSPTSLVPNGDGSFSYHCVLGAEVKTDNGLSPNYLCNAPAVWAGVPGGSKCRCETGTVYDGTACITPASCLSPKEVVNDTCVCGPGYHAAAGNTCAPDCAAEVCDATCSTQPLPVNFPALDYSWNRASLKCPSLFGGSAGFSFGAQGQFDATSAVCGNDCVASEAKKFKFTPTFTLCGKSGASRGLSGTLELSASDSVKYGKMCDTDTCGTVCDASKRCVDESFTASITGGTQWNASIGFGKAISGTPVAIGVFCQGAATLQGGGTLARATKTNVDFGAGCDACEDTTLGPRIFGKATGGCTVSLVRDLPKDALGSGTLGVGSADGLSLEYSQDLLYTQKSGACGSEDCITSIVSGKASVELPPTKCISSFGRGVKLQLKASIGGKCTGSTCPGTPSEGCEWSPDVASIVARTCKP